MEQEKEHKGVGEKVAETIASVDQHATTALRDATHAMTDGASRIANAAKGTSDSSTTTTHKQPIIHTPKEGVAVGDPAGGANVVAATKSTGKGIVDTVAGALGLGGDRGVVGAPAGPSDTDPRTANVPVGDFKALNEALEAPTRTTDSIGASDLDTGIDSSSLKDSAENVKNQVQDAAAGAKEKVQEGAASATGRVQEGIDSAKQAASDASNKASDAVSGPAATPTTGTGAVGGGQGLLAGLADLVTSIATKVNVATNSEEVLAGGVVPDVAAGPGATAGNTTAPAPEAKATANAAADTANRAKESVKDAAGSAGDSVSDAANRLSESARDAGNRVSETAKGAVNSAEDAARDASNRASEVAQSGKEQVNAAASSIADQAGAVTGKAEESTAGLGTKLEDQAADAKVTGSSLVQDAKEGLVGAYDKTADAVAGAAGAAKSTAASVASGDEEQQQQQPGASSDKHPGSGGRGDQGSVLGVLKQGWQDLKHGGGKAPHATSTAGETHAAHDVTSNVERSKHLADPKEAKVYDAETYRVSPGGQASSDQAATNADKASGKAGAVAGDNRQVTGTTPHGKPESYGVGADQQTRFSGDKGMATGFGTGSAAPYSGSDEVKKTMNLFNNSSGAQVATAELADGVDRTATTTAGSIAGWMSGMASVWSNLGRASAKGPTGKDVPSDALEGSKTDVMVDPNRGAVPMQSETPGHKVMMRPPEQVPADAPMPTPGDLLTTKAERLGKAVVDSATTSSEEAAADPNNLKGKSSDGKPDGEAYWLKHELTEAGRHLAEAPQKVAGVVHSMVDKFEGAGHNLTQRNLGGDNKQSTPPAVGTAGDKLAQAARDTETLQNERYARIEITPSKAGDEQHAKELAASYHQYKAGKGTGSDEPGADVAAAASSIGQEATDTAKATGEIFKMESDAAARGVKQAAGTAGDKVQDAAQDAKQTAAAAKDKAAAGAHDAKEQVKERAAAARDTAVRGAEGVKERTKDAAQEADSTARATGQVVRDEAKIGAQGVENAAQDVKNKAADAAESVKNRASHAADRAGEAVQDVKEWAADAAGQTGDRAQEGLDRAAEATGWAAGRGQEAVDDAKGVAARAGQEAGATAGGLLSNVGNAAKALLGGLMGPFEKEGAFDEATAVKTGPLKDGFQPAATEQLTSTENRALDVYNEGPQRASNIESATANTGATAAHGTSSRVAAAPAGADVGEQVKQAGQGVKQRVQAGVDDAAHAAGLAAGHTQGGAEVLIDQVKAQVDQVKEQVAGIADEVKLPPAEAPTNTEDLLKAKAAAGQV
eukprot:GHRR01000079.1.p1 GENE.GHRR01000079.1~~GHRR01000079.1.p1  ORF type:complete len:1291 (+),score=611.78 GHRR01000079.1:263-4135(+)